MTLTVKVTQTALLEISCNALTFVFHDERNAVQPHPLGVQNIFLRCSRRHLHSGKPEYVLPLTTTIKKYVGLGERWFDRVTDKEKLVYRSTNTFFFTSFKLLIVMTPFSIVYYGSKPALEYFLDTENDLHPLK
ncbi:hypothetical protein EB796_017857 [Bugula neritina]|uniref:Uncharacterized protein n=1 Tax=Bugula neritina TaxID=10212 RepID=A0A7J7JC43_BUGNE|nr:hypothetical protein EB796_017857 [Bugula neritina]